MNFKIITLGCKVNIYESEIMKELLLKVGYVESESNLGLIIINTCSVTNMADNKSKKMIRSARRDNPESIIVVCGCCAENHKEVLSSLNIDILIGNKDKSKIVDLINEYKMSREKIIRFYPRRQLEFEDMKVGKFTSLTRAFVKIQDGCNNFCSYCIIPFMRGNLRSKNIDDVYKEVLELVKNNHQEIVFTGIHTGSYGEDTDYDLVDLIRLVSKIDGLKRIRISSIEITEVNDKFINELKDNPKLCSHMHIPLQAGSDYVLKLMNRKYNKSEYATIIKRLKSVRKDISISTDVLVGFPSESEKNFDETLDFCKEMEFSKIHVFPYSKREGTKACEILGHLDNNVKKTRARRLIRLSDMLEESFNKNFLNSIVSVLIEEVYEDYSVGHTSNFIKVKIDGVLNKNQIYDVRIVEIDRNCVSGKICIESVV